jgi:hypothetical protein
MTETDGKASDLRGFQCPSHIPTGNTGATGAFNGKLQMGLSYRPAYFSDDTAGRFLYLYVEEIRNYMLALEAA